MYLFIHTQLIITLYINSEGRQASIIKLLCCKGELMREAYNVPMPDVLFTYVVKDPSK